MIFRVHHILPKAVIINLMYEGKLIYFKSYHVDFYYILQILNVLIFGIYTKRETTVVWGIFVIRYSKLGSESKTRGKYCKQIVLIVMNSVLKGLKIQSICFFCFFSRSVKKISFH